MINGSKYILNIDWKKYKFKKFKEHILTCIVKRQKINNIAIIQEIT